MQDTRMATPQSAIYPPRNAGWRISLRISLLTSIVVMVAMTATAIHLLWAWTSARNTEDIVTQLNRQIISALKTEVDAVIRGAMQDQGMIARLLGENAIPAEGGPAVETLLLSFVKSNPYYSFAGVGLPSGDYLGAQRRDNAQLASIVSRWNAAKKNALRTERYFTTDGKEWRYFKTVEKVSDYYAPERVWYSMATDHPVEQIVTDTYTFSSTGRPGVNTAQPIWRDGKLLGVATIAIELDRLSDFMKRQSVSATGTVFMVDSKGYVIASREAVEFAASSSRAAGDLSLPRLQDVQTRSLAVAWRALSARGLQDFGAMTDTVAFRHTEQGEDFFVSVLPAGVNRWSLVTLVPAQDMESRVARNSQYLLLIVLAVTALAAGLALWLGQRGFVQPLSQIIAQTRQIARFDLTAIARVPSRIQEVDDLSNAVVQMGAGLASFGKYLPAGLVKTLLAQGVVAEPYAEKRTMSVFFMDLAGFTTISEALGPKIVPYLDRYFGSMTAQIEAERGTIDKFIGDCVMAFWGAPHYDEEHATQSCAAALRCLATLEQLRAEWPAQWASQLDVRIGVNTGRVIVGNIGSHARINYTVVGDPVNLASRLETACKGYGVRCLIGQGTYELAKYDIVARRIDVSHVKGKQEPVVMYELLAMAADVVNPAEYAWVAVYDAALSALLAGDVNSARAGFQQTIEMRGDDPPSRVMLARFS